MPSGHRPTAVVRGALSVLGELLLTFGLVLGLFAAYELWWTDVIADRHEAKAQQELLRTWQAPPDASTPGTGVAPAYDVGGALGILHVPALGRGYSVLVKEGTSTAVLNQGVAGHYTSPPSALPWDASGNFALAAHRDGHGAKFHNIDKIGAGDAIVFETRTEWYVYRVDNTLPKTSKDNVGAITPVPAGSGYTTPGHYITLTSCTPVFTSLYRIVVWGHLTETVPVDQQRTPPAALR
ncbi:class E sortase [Kitasatospora sp. NPDC048540]|uniref:class E sortase n=1 Tax=Kitasatospora sp. NPDC048540 TaxID=3155634 RepID=UPI0033D768B9